MSTQKKSYKFRKYQAKTSEGNTVFLHKHCPVCNRMVPPEGEYCSDACKALLENKDKGKKKKLYRNIAFFVIAMVLLVVVMIILGNQG